MVLQASAPVQNPYKERHWHAVPRVCLCFSAGRVQGPTKTRSYFAYLACFVYFDCLSTSAWLDQCQSAIVYEHHEQAQVLYVIPVSSILGRLPLVVDLFLWERQGRYPSPCFKKRLTFQELSAINQLTVVMVVGGGGT